jgi:hypothetical protein
MSVVARQSRPKPAVARSQARTTQAYSLQYDEKAERERPRRGKSIGCRSRCFMNGPS